MARIKYLVFGDGLLGSAFKYLENAAVLSQEQCDITKVEDIETALNYYRPQIVVNCAGIVPKNKVSIERTFKVNSFAPHYIANVCGRNYSFVHVSTDCVFNGEQGRYVERDTPDAHDIYGMSKAFGEPKNDCLVIRTSFVGLPDTKKRGLLAWASQQKEITGYDNVLWNGVTTLELVKSICNLAEQGVEGMRHVYSYTVSKYELLRCANEVFNWGITIYKESEICAEKDCHIVDRTLNSMYATGFVAKPIKRQLKELYDAIQ